MRRLLQRWTADARDYLQRRVQSLRLRRARRGAGRFHAPYRKLASRLLRSYRAYRLYLPPSASMRDRLPLLVMLHGCEQDALAFAEGTRMNQLADRHDFMVLYPEQNRRANPYGCWRWYEPEVLEGTGEAAEIARIVRKVVRRYPVDPQRVYVTGMSAGGAMACVLVNCYGTLFAACAVHSGLKYRAAASPSAAVAAMRKGSSNAAAEAPSPARPAHAPAAPFVPTLVIHGDEDDVVSPVNAEQIVEQVRMLAEEDGAPSRPLVETAERRVSGSGRAYRLQDYEQDGRIVLRKIIVEGLGHAWSGGDERHRFNDPQGPDASRIIWEFVSEFRRAPDGTGVGRRRRRLSLSALWRRLSPRAGMSVPSDK